MEPPLGDAIAMTGTIIALASDAQHRFGKVSRKRLRLIAGFGVEGDAHARVAVQHRSRVAKDPTAPNLRQVHLIHAELLGELAGKGFAVAPGQMGENVTTSGINLLALSTGTRLRLGDEALLEVTGLRNPCRQIDENIASGAMAALLDRAADGSLIRKAGVMGIVLESGDVRLGDPVTVEWAPQDYVALGPV